MLQFYKSSDVRDQEEARRIVVATYQKSGYVVPSDEDPFSRFYLSGNMDTYIAQWHGASVGTISLVRPTSENLPMDCIFKEELAQVRVKNRIGEVCQFAIQIDTPETAHMSFTSLQELDVSMGLLGHIVNEGLQQEIDVLAFVVNPKHASFYTSLGGIQIGSVKPDPMVNNAPACAYILPLANIERMQSKNFILRKIATYLR
jgi:hypothetical protein